MWINMEVHAKKSSAKGKRQKITSEHFHPSHFVYSIHTQLLFLRYLGALCPGLWGNGGIGERRLSYSITWFCSWSPCVNCAITLCQFLSKVPNLRLRIFVSRLYFCDLENSREREGLRMLTKAGVQITVMSYKGAVKIYVNRARFHLWTISILLIQALWMSTMIFFCCCFRLLLLLADLCGK